MSITLLYLQEAEMKAKDVQIAHLEKEMVRKVINK